MIQQNKESLQKIEVLIRKKLIAIDNFFTLVKSFSLKVDSFIKIFYQLLFSIIDDELQELEYPTFSSNQWENSYPNRVGDAPN